MRLTYDAPTSSFEDIPQPDYAALAAAAAVCLAGRFAEYGAFGVVVSLVSDPEMTDLNARYRALDEPTDVLSFPLWEADGCFQPPEGWETLPLGDVVIAPDYVRRSAADAGRDFADEMCLMVVHGTLHLLGFDHDTEARTREMWALQDEIGARYKKTWAENALNSEED